MLLFLLLETLSFSSATRNPCVVEFGSNSSGVGVFDETFSNTPQCSYYGVRYAEAPVEARRFKNPVLHDPRGAQNYTKQGTMCPQMNTHNGSLMGVEDCLVMDIITPFVPGTSKPTKLPVLVYIHGGSFVNGYSGLGLWKGADLLIDKGVIVVSINYRLKVLGFLRHPEFNITGNFGLKDQRAALQWIQKYIHLFGGDPARVTLMGHSAGGASVIYHLYAEPSKGLFQQVISLGGTMIAPWALNYKPKGISAELMRRLNVTSLEELQAIDYKELFFDDRFDFSWYFTMIHDGFVPTLEDPDDPEAFITVSPHTMILDKPASDVPVIVGQTATEYRMMLKYLEFFIMGSYFPHKSWQSIYYDIAKLVQSKINASDKPDIIVQLANLASGYYPVKRTVQHLVSQSSSPVYYFQFEYEGRFGYLKRDQNQTDQHGAAHGDELGYIFSPLVEEEAVANRERFLPEWSVHEETVQLVSDFVKFGNPTPQVATQSKLVWPQYRKDNSTARKYLNIGQSLEILPDTDSEDDLFNFYEPIYECLYYHNCDEVEVMAKSTESSQFDNIVKMMCKNAGKNGVEIPDMCYAF
ncbi:esterase B1-like [Culex pipiens pallens]|uniref:esterase B1-like n=1 Tax=Culex pipiens pallens TaxID=42434 RepID=UPI0019540FB4|nr:esterase B1-like [Culex pipiens pallens]